jgi:hypothetical protein
VGFVSGTDEAEARKIVEQEGGMLREYHAKEGYGLALFAAEHPSDEVIRRLLTHGEIRYAEPNRIGRKQERP